MKHDGDSTLDNSLSQAASLRRILDGPLANAERTVAVTVSRPVKPLRQWFHVHDEWELFCPLNRPLHYEIAGYPPAVLEVDHLLLIAPGCVHMASAQLPQADDLCVVLLRLAGGEAGTCSLYIGGVKNRVLSSVLSATEADSLASLLGEPPYRVMQRVGQAVAEGPWGKERALGLLRVLLAGYAQIAAGRVGARPVPGQRKAMDALAYLQSRYYDRGLSVADVGRAAGLSASHLGVLFRSATGGSVHQALMDIRLRRAMALLQESAYTIKEIAVLTGWSSQFHLSAAILRRYGQPPSAFRCHRKE